jgi:MFS family permease
MTGVLPPATETASFGVRSNAFRFLWLANAVRGAGADIAEFALPVTAVELLHATAFAVSAIFIASRAGFLLVGLPSGVWVDRWRKNRVLVGSDAVCAVAFATVPVAYAFGVLGVAQLAAVALVVSITEAFFTTAHSSVLPYLMDKREIADANARLQASDNTISAIAPGVAGAVVQAVAAPLLYGFAALCQVVSVLALGRVRTQEPTRDRQAGQRGFLRELRQGASFLVRQPLLRLMLVQAALINLGAGLMLSLLPLLVIRQLGLPTWFYGLISSLSAVAGLTAALLCPRLRRKFGEIRMMLVFTALAPVAVVAAPLAGVADTRYVSGALVMLSALSIGFVVVGRAVSTAGLRARTTPNEYLGRVSAANNWITQGATPLGALIGGVVASYQSLNTALFLAVAAMTVPVISMLLSPVRSMRTLPAEWEHPG